MHGFVSLKIAFCVVSSGFSLMWGGLLNCDMCLMKCLTQLSLSSFYLFVEMKCFVMV